MPPEELAKAYEPKDVESRWYPFWEKSGFFTADPASGQAALRDHDPAPQRHGLAAHRPRLHAAPSQDVIVRWKRMSGFDTLWLPGPRPRGHRHPDGGGAPARQGRQEEGRPRPRGVRGARLGVEGGERRHDPQAAPHHGLSLDWTRERFTMDPGMSRAVREVFVQLYEEGLIYRGDYIVNWCPRCVTASRDLEVEHGDGAGSLWHIRYPAKAGGRRHRGRDDAPGDAARRHRGGRPPGRRAAHATSSGKTLRPAVARAGDPGGGRRASSTASSARAR